MAIGTTEIMNIVKRAIREDFPSYNDIAVNHVQMGLNLKIRLSIYLYIEESNFVADCLTNSTNLSVVIEKMIHEFKKYGILLDSSDISIERIVPDKTNKYYYGAIY